MSHYWSGQYLFEPVLVPNAVDPLSVPSVEHALPLHHILLESALKHLAVRELQLAPSVLQVLAEVT